MEKKIYLTLDLEQDYGTALQFNNYHALSNLKPLLNYLEKKQIPLTIFIQTKLIEQKLINIDFSKYNRVYKKVATYFTWMSREITQKKTSTLKKRTFPEIF